jgi:hypothetical protein
MKDKSFTGWLVYDDGVIDKSCSGIGYIYGLHCSDLDGVFDAVVRYFEDGDFEFEAIEHGSVDFIATNVIHQDGQMSFPETGQWDFPPHWEMDIEVAKVELFKHEDQNT